MAGLACRLSSPITPATSPHHMTQLLLLRRGQRKKHLVLSFAGATLHSVPSNVLKWSLSLRLSSWEGAGSRPLVLSGSGTAQLGDPEQ